MGLLLGFLPFIAFSLLQDRLGSTLALAAGALIGAGLAARSLATPPHRLKILEACAAVVFAGLAIWSHIVGAELTLVMTQLCVKAGMLAIVLITLAIGQPFTLAYAREQVDPAYWDSPRLMQSSYIITGAWAAVFALMIAGDLFLLVHPGYPQTAAYLVALCCMGGGVAFTLLYARRARAKAA